MCANTGAHLHLAGPLGFDLEEKNLRRAGLDYHDLARVSVHEDFRAAFDALPGARVFAFTAHAEVRFTDVSYVPGDVLLFGTEPTGLGGDVLGDPRVTECVRLPMVPGNRSMNLSNAAAVAVFEVWRQLGFVGGR
ncbi:rRNA methyltransferase [Corynebacterium aquilae DSM 44791]|uniref:Putative tRNA (cytidine(34)-2'-O)-methyltransferase n=2 Tax=Corynebacterium aquilae TaxID=203263 RepID=A0A1L7CE41_9CORY|nr:rRNA methyltransferase [Corynebacterium aquilae DSM 44791]